MDPKTNGAPAPSNVGSEATKAIATPAEAAPQPKKTKAEIELEAQRAKVQLEKATTVATQATSIFDPIAYAQLKQLANDLIAGGAISADCKTAEQLLVKLQAGFELGMTPIQSLNSLYIVNGKVTIYGAALIGRIREKGWKIRYKDEDTEKTTMLVSRDSTLGAEEIEDTFYYQDAVDSGYTNNNGGSEKVGWRKGQNRKLKMRYGVSAQVVKTYIPEVLNGQNIGVTEIDGDVIEGEIVATADTKRERIQAAADKRREFEEANFVPKSVEPQEASSDDVA